jgi:hypothetical protein
MATALRRKLNSLHRLAQHPNTPPHEAIATDLAIERILQRLGNDRERLVEKEPPYKPRQPTHT